MLIDDCVGELPDNARVKKSASRRDTSITIERYTNGLYTLTCAGRLHTAIDLVTFFNKGLIDADQLEMERTRFET